MCADQFALSLIGVMSIRTLLIGLPPSDNRTFEDVFARMGLPVDIAGPDGEAGEVAVAPTYNLVIVDYEADGCGLPLAVRLLAARTNGAPPDCVIVADQACPALSRAADDLGLLAVLSRPVSTKSLASVMAVHVAKQQSRNRHCANHS